MEFSEKLREYRKRANLTQQDLAKLINVSQGAVVQYENGTSKPKIDKMQKIAKVLKVRIYDLLDEQEARNLQSEFVKEPFSDNVSIPKLNIFAGAGSEGVFDITLLGNDKNISVSREIIGALNPANLRAIEIIGDSMEPEFYEGDIAVVDMVNFRYNFVKIAGIYIVRTGEAIYIKKVDFLPRGGIKLISINKSYGDMELGADDDFEILGKVCGKIHFTKGLIFTTQGIN